MLRLAPAGLSHLRKLTQRPNTARACSNSIFNTSGPLSYLLGTNFRQLPSNERKCLDVIPVDMVCRGMTLIAAAAFQQQDVRDQLATSAINPVNMGRSIELTGLAHRKHYRTQRE